MAADRFSLSENGGAAVAVISCLSDDDTGGGLFTFDGLRTEQLDSLSSTGLCKWGDKAIRLLRATERTYGVAEMLVYDCKGVEQYFRLDPITAPHEGLWDAAGCAIACPAPHRN